MMRASITGRLGADPVLRETKSGKPMMTASAACDVGRPGHEPLTEWINLIAFGTAGEALGQHAKGDLVSAMGTLTKSTFTDREGKERTSWTLAVESLLSVRATYDRPFEDGATSRPRGRLPRPNSNGPFFHKEPAPPRSRPPRSRSPRPARPYAYSARPGSSANHTELPNDPVDDMYADGPVP